MYLSCNDKNNFPICQKDTIKFYLSGGLKILFDKWFYNHCLLIQ